MNHFELNPEHGETYDEWVSRRQGKGPVSFADYWADRFERDLPPLTVACGVGVDSVAMLVALWGKGIRPDLITFAMTGSEKPETYAYVRLLNAWLAGIRWPALTVVFKRVQRFKYGPYLTLEGNCLQNKTLPSISFMFRKGCSMKWKAEPQEAFVLNHWTPGRLASDAGVLIKRLIGYDAGPKDKRRGGVADSPHFSYEYPLREWGMDRVACKALIEKHGLPEPPKSACYFCAVSKPDELIALAAKHPSLAARAVAMERMAKPNLTQIDGLWCQPGKMGKHQVTGEKLPGSWEEFYRSELGERDFSDMMSRTAAGRDDKLEFLGEELMPLPVKKEHPTKYLEVWWYDDAYLLNRLTSGETS